MVAVQVHVCSWSRQADQYVSNLVGFDRAELALWITGKDINNITDLTYSFHIIQ